VSETPLDKFPQKEILVKEEAIKWSTSSHQVTQEIIIYNYFLANNFLCKLVLSYAPHFSDPAYQIWWATTNFNFSARQHTYMLPHTSTRIASVVCVTGVCNWLHTKTLNLFMWRYFVLTLCIH